MYGVRGVNLAWFRSYLANRKQYISLGHDRKTDTRNIFCGVPQGSILGPLLFLLYVNDLPNSSVLEPIMFADDTNLFFEQTDLRILSLFCIGKVEIANEFNTFFTNIGAELAKNIPNASRPFESYINRVDTTMPTDSFTINEVKEAFFSLKINKSPGCDEISFNVIKNCFSELNMPLKYLFDMSLESGIFPDKLKIARVIPA